MLRPYTTQGKKDSPNSSTSLWNYQTIALQDGKPPGAKSIGYKTKIANVTVENHILLNNMYPYQPWTESLF